MAREASILADRKRKASALAEEASDDDISTTDRIEAPQQPKRRLPKALEKLPTEWQNFFKDEDVRLLIGIDFGQVQCATYVAFVHHTELDPRNIVVKPLNIHKNERLMSTLLGVQDATKPGDLMKTGIMVCGDDVRAAMTRGTLSATEVYWNMKQSKPFVKPSDVPKEELARYAALHSAQENTKAIFSRYDKIQAKHSWYDGNKAVDFELGTDEGCVTAFLIYFLLEIKAALWATSSKSLEKSFIDNMFKEGHALNEKVRIGIAIPELWKGQRGKFFELLLKAEYPATLELLSEGRCALAHSIKLELDESLGENYTSDPATRQRKLEELQKPLYLGYDKGGYSTDMAIMKVLSKNSIVRIRVVGQSNSTSSGSQRANDLFKRALASLFGPHLQAVMQNTGLDELGLQCHFDQGFELAKLEYRKDPKAIEPVVVTFFGENMLGSGKTSHASWQRRALTIDRKTFERFLTDPIQEEFEKDSEVRIMHRQARRYAKDRPVHVMPSGGGVKSDFVQAALKNAFRGSKVTNVGTGSGSHVAAGACLTLADPGLSARDNISQMSLGVVADETDIDMNLKMHQDRAAEVMVTDDGIKVLPDTVHWKRRMDEPPRTGLVTQWLEHTMYTTQDGLDNPLRTEWPLIYEFQVVLTTDKEVGLVDGCSARHPSIVKLEKLEFEITQEIATQIGLPKTRGSFIGGCHKDVRGRWCITFKYLLTYQWRGFLDFFELAIPLNTGEHMYKRFFRPTGLPLLSDQYDMMVEEE